MTPYRKQITGLATLLGMGLSHSGFTLGTVDNAAPLEQHSPAGAAFSEHDGIAALTDENPLAAEQMALNDDSLQEIRGGFSIGNGLQVSFGIERAVYIDGNLVTTTHLNVGDLGRLSGGQDLPEDVGKGLALIQNGAGNTFNPGEVLPNNLGTVIQNTLDNQKIQNMTVIQATVNSVNIIKSLDLQNSIRDAINSSLLR